MASASRSSNRPTAIITGASMGIGLSLAQHFAKAGHDLVLVARSADKLRAAGDQLQQKYGVNVHIEPSDLSKPDAPAKLHAALAKKKISVDVLVNCAGVLQQSPFLKIPADQGQQMIDLNISGLTQMLHQFLPAMVAKGSGRVLNVASIAAFQPIPTLAIYAATKAYVLSLTESLAEELRDTGVTVTALCPGMTATHMLQSATSANAGLPPIPSFLIADVDDVARLGFEATMKGDVICVPGIINQAAMIASRGTPKWLVRRLGGLLGRKMI